MDTTPILRSIFDLNTKDDEKVSALTRINSDHDSNLGPNLHTWIPILDHKSSIGTNQKSLNHMQYHHLAKGNQQPPNQPKITHDSNIEMEQESPKPKKIWKLMLLKQRRTISTMSQSYVEFNLRVIQAEIKEKLLPTTYEEHIG